MHGTLIPARIPARRRARLTALVTAAVAACGIVAVGSDAGPLGAAGSANPFVTGRAPALHGRYDALVASDVNADGACDLVAYRAGSAGDRTWLGQRSGAFLPGPAPRLTAAADAVPTADFDGDGFGDLLFARPVAGRERLALGRRSGRFDGGTTIDVNRRWDALVAGDFDGNGFADLFAYRAGSAADELWRGGPGGLVRGSAPRVDKAYGRVVAGDFNGDGRDDILFYGRGAAADRLLRGRKSGTFKVVEVTIRGSYREVIAGDFDGDGRDDAFFYNPGRRGDRLARGGVTVGFNAGPALSVNGSYLPLACDFDADGADDVLWYAPGRGVDRLWRGTPRPFRTGHVLPSGASWLQTVNYYRAMSRLPLVTENPTWSRGAYLHARYVVETGMTGHDEDPSSPWYTPEGAEAGAHSNIAYGAANDAEFVDMWMQAPFHAAGIVHPRLVRSGFGSYRKATAEGVGSAAALDVLHGRSYGNPFVSPVVWPGDGSIVHLTLHWGETPSPLTACRGYTEPAGLPIVVLLPEGETSHGARAVVRRGSRPVEACLVTTANHDWVGADQIIVVPRYPLHPGSTYSVTVYTGTRGLTWRFHVGDALDR